MPNQEEYIIRTEGLTKRYGTLVAVNNLNLAIRKGEVFGLLGPNGAGKTTIIRMLLGLSEPTSGTATVCGLNCTRASLAVKQLVGYLPDNVGFYDDMTGRENLLFTGELNGINRVELRERIERNLARVSLTAAADKPVGTYSRGMRQRLGIADILVKNPQVIILDEPTLGIDPEGVYELMELIRTFAKAEHRTILVSSHQLYQVQRICDHMGIFYQGNLVACGNIEELGAQVCARGETETEFMVTQEPPTLKAALAAIDGVTSVLREKDFYVLVATRDICDDLQKLTETQQLSLRHLRRRGDSLEDVYRKYFVKQEAETI